MRRTLSLVMVGLGAFLVVTALMVRFYAYPSLAKVPADFSSTTNLEAKDATVFNSDPSVLAAESTDLSILNRTVADGAAMKKAPSDVAIWVSSSTISRSDGSVFQRSTERSAFDDFTGAGVKSADSFQVAADGEQVAVSPEGQVYKFPFGTQKKDYQVWDATLGKATTAEYTGTAKVDGLDVYTFQQVVAPTTVGSQDVPGSLLGSDAPSVEADLVYENDRTFYIEPITGSPVNRVEKRHQELQYDGQALTVFDGTITYTSDQVASTAKDIKAKAPLLGGMRVTFPAIFGLLGLLLIAGGTLLRRGGRGAAGPAPVKKKQLVDA